MKTLSHRIIHFRFLEHSQDIPISMREFRAIREEVQNANNALLGVSMLRFPEPQLSAKGGYTVVVLTNNETNEEWLGVAKCDNRDHFVRRIGSQDAFNVAKLAMNEGSNNIDELWFYETKADRNLLKYLKDNELLRDDLVPVVDMLNESMQELKQYIRQQNPKAIERQQKHAEHLAAQKIRAAEWHAINK